MRPPVTPPFAFASPRVADLRHGADPGVRFFADVTCCPLLAGPPRLGLPGSPSSPGLTPLGLVCSGPFLRRSWGP